MPWSCSPDATLPDSHTLKVLDTAQKAKLDNVSRTVIDVQTRRLAASDLRAISADKWYLCASKELRAAILNWLEGKTVVYESFEY